MIIIFFLLLTLHRLNLSEQIFEQLLYSCRSVNFHRYAQYYLHYLYNFYIMIAQQRILGE